MNILQTPVRFYPAVGGVENHVYYLSKELVKQGHSVKVICADEPTSKIKSIFGIEVKRLKTWFKITNTNITLSLPFEILKSKYDIIHAHMPTPWSSDWSILLSKLMGKKSIITIHNDMDKAGFLSKIITEIYLHTIFLLSLSLVDKIIIVNKDWERSFSNTGKILSKFINKIIVSPNGVDTDFFKPLKVRRNKNSVLFVSILDKHHEFKGLSYLLEAIKLVKKTIPDIKLTIVGEGEMKNFYINKVRELSIEKSVKFAGEKNQKELVSLYNSHSVFVLPSTEIEGFGIVTIEAMACKTPVIITNIVGVAGEVEKNNCGIVVQSKSAEDLGKAIIMMLINTELFKNVGENGQKLIETKYSWKRIVRQIIIIYDNIKL